MRRNFLITVEGNSPGSEMEGEPTENWAEVRKVYGSIMPLSGREYLLAQQVKASVSHQIRTEFFTGASPRMRLMHNGRTFHVESVVNVKEQNRELEWMCTEVVSG